MSDEPKKQNDQNNIGEPIYVPPKRTRPELTDLGGVVFLPFREGGGFVFDVISGYYYPVDSRDQIGMVLAYIKSTREAEAKQNPEGSEPILALRSLEEIGQHLQNKTNKSQPQNSPIVPGKK